MADSVDLGIDELTDFRQVGAGGFSTVYAAWDDGFERHVAVKVLHSLDDDGRRRFDRERRIMGRLAAHPNVITPFRAGYTNNGAPFLVMEFVEGGSLEDLQRAHGQLPWETALDHVMPITAALGHAHTHGVLHRDVKPANILLAGDVPKLTDFGIAAIRESTASQIGYTLAHCPPETFAGGRDGRDDRSDLYSMASTLHTLIAGRSPFEVDGPDSQQAYMFRILDQDPPSLPSRVAPPELSAFITAALAKDPEVRPRNARQFGEQLAAIRAGVNTDGSTATLATYSAPVVLGLTPPTAAPTVPILDGPGSKSAGDLEQAPTVVATDVHGVPPTQHASAEGPTVAHTIHLTAESVSDGPTGTKGRGRPEVAGPTVGRTARSRWLRPIAAIVTLVIAGTAAVIIAGARLGDRTIVFEQHQARVDALAVLTDGRIASGSSDDTVLVWDPAEPEMSPAVFDGHKERVRSVVALSDGRVASASDPLTGAGIVRVWDPNDPSGEATAYTGHEGGVTALLELADGRLASASDPWNSFNDHAVHLWQPSDPTGTPMTFDEHSGAVTGLALLADGRIASGGEDDTVRVWDPGSLSATTIVFSGHEANIQAVVSLGGSRMASASCLRVLVWDIDRIAAEPIMFSAHSDCILTLAALPDGRIASGGEDHLVRVWDPDNLDEAPIVFADHTSFVYDLAVLADGRIASASTDGTVRIWDPDEV